MFYIFSDFEVTEDEYSDLEFECSSEDVSDTDFSDGEQTIEPETERDKQCDRVSFMAALFKKTFAVKKTKVKPVSHKEDGMYKVSVISIMCIKYFADQRKTFFSSLYR